ncbi:MAG: hypothetical protein ABSH20_28345 [Tepidisphaeraceae bacterium]|jgi:hypothetical protein
MKQLQKDRAAAGFEGFEGGDVRWRCVGRTNGSRGRREDGPRSHMKLHQDTRRDLDAGVWLADFYRAEQPFCCSGQRME